MRIIIECPERILHLEAGYIYADCILPTSNLLQSGGGPYTSPIDQLLISELPIRKKSRRQYGDSAAEVRQSSERGVGRTLPISTLPTFLSKLLTTAWL